MNEQQMLNREDEGWVHISNRWLALHREIKAMEGEERELREMLIQMAGEQNVTGGGVRLTRSVRKGSVQYSQIPELEHVDLDQYRKPPMEIWRLVPSDHQKTLNLKQGGNSEKNTRSLDRDFECNSFTC